MFNLGAFGLVWWRLMVGGGVVGLFSWFGVI